MTSHMDPTFSSTPDTSWASARLDTEHDIILSHLTALRQGFQTIVDAAADSNADDEHDPEGSTIAFERAQLTSLIHQAERHLNEIEQALMRVGQGEYGLCQKCGQPISAARLDARPEALTCIGCATIVL